MVWNIKAVAATTFWLGLMVDRLGVHAQSLSGAFNVLTYNVAGLPGNNSSYELRVTVADMTEACANDTQKDYLVRSRARTPHLSLKGLATIPSFMFKKVCRHPVALPVSQHGIEMRTNIG